MSMFTIVVVYAFLMYTVYNSHVLNKIERTFYKGLCKKTQVYIEISIEI